MNLQRRTRPAPAVLCSCPQDTIPASSPTVLVPLKSPTSGKTRLGSHLDRAQRAMLTTAMLRDVVALVRRAGVERPVLVTADPAGDLLGQRFGLPVVIDPPTARGLDDAIEYACEEFIGAAVVVIMADVPTLAHADLARLFRCRAPVTILPSHDGGTVALARRPGTVIPTRFGPSSARRHAATAAAQGVACHFVLPRSPLHDVDTFDDLIEIVGAEPGPATSAALARLHALLPTGNS